MNQDISITFTENSPFNPLTTSVPHHIETSQLIFSEDQLTGFYVMGGTLVVNGLRHIPSNFYSQYDTTWKVYMRLIINPSRPNPGQRERGLNFKIHDVTTWLANNCNTNIAQYLKKGNQARKFGQLTEYNMRNIYVEKSYTKCSGETTSRPLSKKSKLSISVDQQGKVLNSFFLLYANLRAIEIQ